MDDEDVGGGGRHHSLAHELAVALMPEPSAGSKLLAEEFGIEFDEGAEGIDDVPNGGIPDFAAPDADVPSLASELGTSASDASFHDLGSELDEPPAPSPSTQHDPEFDDPVFSSPTVSRRRAQQKSSEKDAMEVLAQNMESTEKFLDHLQGIDGDPSLPTSSSTAAVEMLAHSVISRMSRYAADREEQVRELLEYDREFRRIAAEVGGTDVLGQLEALPSIDNLTDAPTLIRQSSMSKPMSSRHIEEPRSPAVGHNSDWELDPDRHHLGDHDDNVSEPAMSPVKDTFSAPLAPVGPPTPATVLSQLSLFKTFNTGLVSSINLISEHTQVNGAANADAGRKIRALKNKLGSWQTDWDSAERSRVRIEKWEAGILEGDADGMTAMPTSPGRTSGKRVDGRRVVEEHLRAFEKALADAAVKTQAIMAR